ncbi:MAG: hypothetical protein ISS74_09735 [Planctomycetes bacterium]|nr:hypothetical protein [Planctomycetota bacterium]
MSMARLCAVLGKTLLCLALLAVADAGAAERPNILLIVSEDNGPELGCYGEPFVKTPMLDRPSRPAPRPGPPAASLARHPANLSQEGSPQRIKSMV